MIKKISKYLLIGLVSVIPAIIVIQISTFIYDIVLAIILSINGYTQSPKQTFIAIFASISFLVLIGHSVTKYGSSTYVKFFDIVVDKLPLLSNIYSVTKKVLNMFFAEHERFSEMVFIEYPRRGLWTVAYVTNKTESKYILFIPTSPNPTSGFTVVVDPKEIIPTDLSMEEATSFIVSIGVDLERKDIIEEMEMLP